MNKVADTKRLKDVLQAYGANQDNWPADERSALAELVASDDPGVQACLQDAREMDFCSGPPAGNPGAQRRG